MERIEYPVPQPVPALSVRCLGPDDAAQIAALYRAAGRDGAWCGEDTVHALFGTGAVWWGGFAEGELALCVASAASAADTPQAAALRGALAPGIGCSPEYFLLPPAISHWGESLAGALLPLLAQRLFLSVNGAGLQKGTEPLLQYAQNDPTCRAGERWLHGSEAAVNTTRPKSIKTAPVLLAALPVKAPAPVLAAYFAAGFAAVRMRPLVSLRPHYLFRRRGALGQETENTAPPPKREPDALRRVYLPLADTLAVSRLLEQGFCATALCRSSADERTLIRLVRGSG